MKQLISYLYWKPPKIHAVKSFKFKQQTTTNDRKKRLGMSTEVVKIALSLLKVENNNCKWRRLNIISGVNPHARSSREIVTANS